MDKQFFTGQITKSDSDEFDGTFVLSTEDVDRDGDVILADGWKLAHFRKNPIALWQHDHSQPVGAWHNIRVEGKRLIADLKVASTNLGQMAKTLIEENILKAVSVGFRVDHKDVEPRDETDPGSGFLFKRAELLETSLVSVGANPYALRIGKSLNLTDSEMRLIIGERNLPEPESKSADPAVMAKAQAALGASAESHPQTHSKSKDKPMKLSDRIEAKRTEIVALRDELATATEKYAEEATEENQAVVEEFAGRIEQAEKELHTFETAEAKMTAIVQNKAAPQAPAPGIITDRKNYDPAELIFRNAAVKLISHVNQQSMADVIRERYRGDKGLEAIVKATDADPATTTDSAWAGVLLEEQVQSFVDLLANNSVYGSLRGPALSLNFSGAASIKIPARSATPNLAGDFVGEGAPIRVGQLAFTSKSLTRHKMAVISTMTEEIANATNNQIEAIVRQAILDDTGKVLDSRLLDNVAGTAVRPAGLLNGVTPTASSGATVANIITDLKALLNPFNTDDAGKNLRIIINPQRLLGLATATNAVGQMQFADEVGRGQLMGIPLVVSANVATDEVHCVNAGEFATAYDGPRFTVSNTATLHMEQDQVDVDPIGTTGVPNIVAAPVRSLFQTDTLGIRMILPVTWDMRRDSQVSSLSAVAW